MAFGDIALVVFGLALDTVIYVDCLVFLGHLTHNLEETGLFLTDRRVLDGLPTRNLKDIGMDPFRIRRQ